MSEKIRGCANEERRVHQDFLEENLSSIRRTIKFLCSQANLKIEVAADFESWAILKLIDNDYAILKARTGEQSISYLRVVLRNLLHDFRNRLWGKWRPSKAAIRIGSAAVDIERITHRDGFPRQEAVEIVGSRMGWRISRQELETIADRLPNRARRPVEIATEAIAVADDRSTRLACRETTKVLRQAKRKLEKAMTALTEEERTLLHLHYQDGKTIASIARDSGLNQRWLYSTRDRCLRRLRLDLRSAGVRWPDLRDLIGRDILETPV